MNECEEHTWTSEIVGIKCVDCDTPQTIGDIKEQAWLDGAKFANEATKSLVLMAVRRVAREVITDEAVRALYIQTLVTQVDRKNRNKPWCPVCERLHDFPARCWADKQDEEIQDGK